MVPEAHAPVAHRNLLWRCLAGWCAEVTSGDRLCELMTFNTISTGAFSGLLAFGISFMSGTDGMLGWSWIFVRLAAYLFRSLSLILALIDY